MIGMFILAIKMMFELVEWSIKLTILIIKGAVVVSAVTFKLVVLMCVGTVALTRAVVLKMGHRVPVTGAQAEVALPPVLG